jgi:hypothetical protein
MIKVLRYVCILTCISIQVQALTHNMETQVAVVLPFSGQQSEFSEEIAEAMQMAMDDLAIDNLALTLIDSNQEMKELMEDLQESKPHVIISTLDENMPNGAIIKYAKTQNICILALSNDIGLTKKGCVVLLAPLPKDEALVSTIFAAESGYQINMLLPNSAESNEIVGALEQQQDIQLNYLQLYDPVKIHEEWYLYDFFAGVRNKAENAKQAIVVNEPEVIPYVGDFLKYSSDTRIIIANAAKNLRTALDNELKNVWFSSVNLAKFGKFQEHFTPSNERMAGEVAALSYDTIAMLHHVISSKGVLTPTISNFLDPEGFAGITGTVRFNADGSNQRLFEISTLGYGRIKKVAPAAVGFKNTVEEEL